MEPLLWCMSIIIMLFALNNVLEGNTQSPLEDLPVHLPVVQDTILPSIAERELIIKQALKTKGENINRIVFHGGCLSCHAYEHLSCAVCYTCTYYNWVGGGKLKQEYCTNYADIKYPPKFLLTAIHTKNTTQLLQRFTHVRSNQCRTQRNNSQMVSRGISDSQDRKSSY